MIQVSKEQWKRIPSDYKVCKKGKPRKVFLGCIQNDGGTVLVTEGIDFEIVKERNTGDDQN